MIELIGAAAGAVGAIALLIRTMADTRKTKAETSLILAELRPNHGSSTRDAIDRLEALTRTIQADTETKHACNLARILQLDQRLDALEAGR